MSDERLPGQLIAGYGVPYDPSAALQRLRDGKDAAAAWEELWRELYHQGDVGPGSYATVPELVAIHRQRGISDWNTFALVATIELARDNPHRHNPGVPDSMRHTYDGALRELADVAVQELPAATEPELIRSILAMIAVQKGARVYARLLLEFDEDEVLDLLQA
jgi:hypothetical protein